MVQAIGNKLQAGEAQVQACSKKNYSWVISQKLNQIQQFAQKYRHVGWRQKDVSTKVRTTNAATKGITNWTPVERAAWVRRPIRSLEVQLAGASEKFRAWSETQREAEAFEDSETAGFDDTESHKREIDSLHEKRMSWNRLE